MRVDCKAGIGLALLGAALLGAPSVASATTSAKSRACWSQADRKGLHGEARAAFHKSCLQGALAPASPTRGDAGSMSARAVTSPSGTDRTQRSQECAAQAQAKGGTPNEQKSIRLACMASAAPSPATGTPTQPPTPTSNKPELGTMPR